MTGDDPRKDDSSERVGSVLSSYPKNDEVKTVEKEGGESERGVERRRDASRGGGKGNEPRDIRECSGSFVPPLLGKERKVSNQ